MKSKQSASVQTSHPGMVLAIIMTGVLMVAIDTTIVVLALPTIERALQTGVTTIIWVIIGYLLVVTILAAQVGRLGDMFGRVRIYQTGFIIFIAASFLCALSWGVGFLILFRIIQGIGGALVSANSSAIIADTFPIQKRGRAYGFLAMGWTIGSILGILIGGVIITYISWRWIFWINVPIGIAVIALSIRILHDKVEQRSHSIDWGGMITLGVGLFCLLWAMTKMTTSSSSFNLTILLLFIGGAISIGAFVLFERVLSEPMLHLSLFKIPTMTPSLLASFFQGLANFAVLFLVLMYLQGVRQLTPMDASLLLVPGYLLTMFIAPMGGRLVDRIGPVIPATVGLGLQAVGLLVYAQLHIGTPLFVVVVGSSLVGIGGGLFFPSNNSAVMKASPSESFGIASGMLRTFSNIGMVMSFSVALLISAETISKGLAFAIFVGTTHLSKDLSTPFTHGLNSAFYGCMVFLVIAGILSASRSFSSKIRFT
ncbi:MAG: MFS transporter [Actinobacteria bacterium]|nr:MFS transporter [Actinomycetota bacterium]MCL6105513.1 MFS transporter [Actinomycetota bacterium]